MCFQGSTVSLQLNVVGMSLQACFSGSVERWINNFSPFFLLLPWDGVEPVCSHSVCITVTLDIFLGVLCHDKLCVTSDLVVVSIEQVFFVNYVLMVDTCSFSPPTTSVSLLWIKQSSTDVSKSRKHCLVPDWQRDIFFFCTYMTQLLVLDTRKWVPRETNNKWWVRSKRALWNLREELSDHSSLQRRIIYDYSFQKCLP